jgi:hypothetical protein
MGGVNSMSKKKKPSYLLILGQLFTDSIWDIGIAFLSGGYLIYRQREDIAMLEQIPVWVWWAVLVFFILRIAVKGVQIYRKELEAQNSLNKPERKRKKKSNKTVNGGIAIQDSTVIDSFKTVNILPDKWSTPSKEYLTYQVGVQIQVFHDKFKPIRHVPPQDKRKQFDEVKKIFDPIYTDLLYQAKLVLVDTDIPKLIEDIHVQLGSYDWRLDHLLVVQKDYWIRIKGYTLIPADKMDRMTEHRKALYEIANEIDSLVQKVMDSVREKH